MNPEPPTARRPIPAIRISTVALLGIVAAVTVPAAAVALVTSGSIDEQHQTQNLSQAGPVTKVVIEDADSSVRVTGDPALSGVSGHASLTWHSFSNKGNAKVTQQYADGVLTLTRDCGDTDCGADIDIHVPPTASVQVNTSNSGVDVVGISGSVNVHTSNAKIDAKQLGSGDTTLNTSNGPIDATFAGGPKNIWAHTSNASVTITTDGRTDYLDKVVASNGEPHTRNNQNRWSQNTIDVLTSNADATVK